MENEFNQCKMCGGQVKAPWYYCFECNKKRKAQTEGVQQTPKPAQKQFNTFQKATEYKPEDESKINQSALACVTGLVKDDRIHKEEMPAYFESFRNAIKDGVLIMPSIEEQYKE